MFSMCCKWAHCQNLHLGVCLGCFWAILQCFIYLSNSVSVYFLYFWFIWKEDISVFIWHVSKFLVLHVLQAQFLLTPKHTSEWNLQKHPHWNSPESFAVLHMGHRDLCWLKLQECEVCSGWRPQRSSQSTSSALLETQKRRPGDSWVSSAEFFIENALQSSKA